MEIHQNLKDYPKFNPKAMPIPLCRGCVRPILDNSVLLLLPHSNQSDLSRDPNPSERRSTTKPTLKTWPLIENQENRRPLRECQESLTTRWTPRDHPPVDFSKIDFYHADCLNCCECGGRLTPLDRRCWKLREYQVICRPCRIRFTHCGRCRVRVNHDVWVHKLDRLPFHVACLTCSQCDRQLRPGDRCGLLEDMLLCMEHYLSATGSPHKPHYQGECAHAAELESSKIRDIQGDELTAKQEKESFVKADVAMKPNGTQFADKREVCESSMKQSDSNFSNFPITDSEPVANKSLESSTLHVLGSAQPRADPISELMPSKLNRAVGGDTWYGPNQLESKCETGSAPQLPTTDCLLPVTETGHSVDSSTSSGCSAHSKSKRIRTSFTPDQLAILQANFDIEANPDGQELERIANVARLNKRVTQVWFQNARARKKKTECKGASPVISMQLNPSMYFIQDTSNSEDYFDPNDEPLLGLVDSNQLTMSEPTGCSLLSSYSTQMSTYKPPGSALDVLAEAGTISTYAAINFQPVNPVDSSELIQRRCLTMVSDPISRADQVYSILNSVRSIPTPFASESFEKNGHSETEKKVDSFLNPVTWSTSSDEPTRGMLNPALVNSAFLDKLTTDGLPPYGNFEACRTFGFPTSRCLADESTQLMESMHHSSADSMRSVTVFGRV